MDTDASQKAAGLKFILNNLLGGVQENGSKEQIFGQAETMIDERKPAFKVRSKVPALAMMEGELVSITVDVLFARWNVGNEAVWLAFGWFKGGWVQAILPLGPDTQTMPWLDKYIKKELGG